MVAIQVTDEKEKIFPIPYLHESEVGEQTGEKKAKEFRKQLCQRLNKMKRQFF